MFRKHKNDYFVKAKIVKVENLIERGEEVNIHSKIL